VLDQHPEHVVVDVVETSEVQASPSHLVRAKLLEQLWISVLNAANEVQDEVGPTRREPDQRRRAFAPAVVAIPTPPEADPDHADSPVL
jgi:hypothetical protein